MSNRYLMNFRMDSELKQRLLAVAQGRNMAAMIREALIQWLAQEERRMRL